MDKLIAGHQDLLNRLDEIPGNDKPWKLYIMHIYITIKMFRTYIYGLTI